MVTPAAELAALADGVADEGGDLAAGYLLPSWEELSDFAALCREREVPLHIDGARLWESTPYLGHSLSEVANLADSVYVSFYKGLGGLAGRGRRAQRRDYAVALADRLTGSGLQATPSPPHTNAFRLHAQVEADVVLERLVQYTEAESTAAPPPWRSADVPGWSWTEFTVGAATVEWPVEEAVATLRREGAGRLIGSRAYGCVIMIT